MTALSQRAFLSAAFGNDYLLLGTITGVQSAAREREREREREHRLRV